MAWHGSCYTPRTNDNFPIAKLRDVDGLGDPKEDTKFKYARNGDNLICPFQCDLCHFRNIQQRNPKSESELDKNLLIAIRRANLDAFWGRSDGTVNHNRGDVRRMMDIAKTMYGIDDLLPEMGPFPLYDQWGMKAAVVMLGKTLDKGIYTDNVQFHTARRVRSAYSNVWGASQHTMTLGIMARDTTKLFVTNSPTYCLWYERFAKGMHSRMGDDHRPDAAISSELLLKVIQKMEVDYYDADTEGEIRYIVRAAVFYLAAYLGSLRGEEVPRILRQYFIDLNKESFKARIPHAVLPMYGSFKGDQGIPRCFLFRLTCKSNSGLDIKTWIERLMPLEAKSRNIYLFSNRNGSKETGRVYEPYLFAKLKEIQREDIGLVPKSLNVEDSFGISRSFRRGSATAALNAPNSECNAEDINRNNRWRSEDKAGTKKASLNMLQLYTDTLLSLKADLKFSQCL
jgi:hypothetical protein